MKYIKLFNTDSDRVSYEGSENYLEPYVSYVKEDDSVHYSTPPFFCKLILNNGNVVKLEGSGELTNAMVSSQYKDTLVSAEIGELCTSIGDLAFASCTGLTNITIPNSVTSIGNMAFQNCSNLSTITSYITNAPSVSAGTFGSVKNGGTLYVPIGSSGYDTWMNNQGNLGFYNWTKVEQ